MKKTIFKITIVLFISVIAFSGCKKGEDDPGISFRSRTARFAGEWTLTSMDKTTIQTSSYYSSTTHETYNGSTLTNVFTVEGLSPQTTTRSYVETFNTEKDGTYKFTKVDDGDTYAEAGNWMWLDENDNMDIENKEAVLLTATKIIEGDDSDTYSGKSNLDGNVMLLKRLANKEMVVLIEYSSTDSDGNTKTINGTYTYTQD